MATKEIPRPFDLLRWFSIVSLLALLPVACATGFILSYFLNQEALQQDGALTAGFIRNCIEMEGRQAGLGKRISFSELLDERVDPFAHGVSREAAQYGRREILEHIQFLPDVLRASLFARDGRIVWSTHPELVGREPAGRSDVDKAFAGLQLVRQQPTDVDGDWVDFGIEPRGPFVEHYIPLYDARGDVVLVAAIYKEPRGMAASIRQGQHLMWGTMVVAAALIFLVLFGIFRAGSSALQTQQKHLVEMDALAFIGEMSTAVAHGLRNPLASIRSSAELALYADCEPVRKNAQDIISQVDCLSRWVRDLLVFTRPVTGEPEAVDLVAVLAEVVESFAPACAKAGIRVVWNRKAAGRPPIEGNTSLVTQVLHSVLSNAIEAMPQGGDLHIGAAVRSEQGRFLLTVRDTGVGMSESQLSLAFKPFHTTKRQGLGVGLAMVKRVMERFGGTVTLSSRENEGTEVRLEFRMA